MTVAKRFFVQIVLISLLTFFILSASLATLVTPALAASDQCLENDSTKSGIMYSVPAGEYNVYVKNSLDGAPERANVSVAEFSDSSDVCTNVGSTTVRDGQWVHAGTFSKTSTDNGVSVYVDSPSLATTTDSLQRLEILFIPASFSCVRLELVCQHAINDTVGELKPVKTALIENAVTIQYILPPQQDKIEQVNYFADSNFLYSSNDLGPIPSDDSLDQNVTRYTRVINYASGQQFVTVSPTPSSEPSGPLKIFERILRPYSTSIRLAAYVFLFGISLIIVSALLRIGYRHDRWQATHGLKPNQSDFWIRVRAVFSKLDYIMAGPRKALLVIALMLYMSTSFFELFTVNGMSMENNLSDNDRIIVWKLGAGWTRLNKGQFVPKRGQVVVFRPQTPDQALRNPENSSTIVKRVIGLPGERVIIDNNLVRIYNKDNPVGIDVELDMDWSSGVVPDQLQTPIDITLNTDEVFVLGDNRNASIDSRIIGPIKTNQIIGQVFFDF